MIRFASRLGRVLAWGLSGLLLLLLAYEGAVAYPSRRTADVAYRPTTDPDFDPERHRLDVYAPRRPGAARRPVVVFIHGGSWNSGHKNFYSFVGRRLARQGLVAVVINYRLAPRVQVPAMADDCAQAVAWAYRHCAAFGGDSARLVLMGHSAGGGLAALLATRPELFRRAGLAHNPVRGVVLDDAAGLNMHTYLQKRQYPGDEAYLLPFGRDSSQWRAVSPYYHLSPRTPPFSLLVGGRTYPSIQHSNQEFAGRLRALGHQPRYTVLPGKKHAAMVLQLYWVRNVVYRQLHALIQQLTPENAAKKPSISTQ